MGLIMVKLDSRNFDVRDFILICICMCMDI